MTRRATLRDVPALWAKREPFNANGTLRGLDFAPLDTGRLPEPWRTEYRENIDRIVYVVRSYATPIAWVLNDGDGSEVIPPVRYSVSTSRHQSRLYHAWGA